MAFRDCIATAVFRGIFARRRKIARRRHSCTSTVDSTRGQCGGSKKGAWSTTVAVATCACNCIVATATSLVTSTMQYSEVRVVCVAGEHCSRRRPAKWRKGLGVRGEGIREMVQTRGEGREQGRERKRRHIGNNEGEGYVCVCAICVVYTSHMCRHRVYILPARARSKGVGRGWPSCSECTAGDARRESEKVNICRRARTSKQICFRIFRFV